MRDDDAGKTRQQELQDAVAKFPIAMVLTNPRLDDNPIVFVNRAFEQVTFYSRDYAVGRNCRFLQGPETDPADVDLLRAAIAAEREISLDLVNHRADGSAFRNRLVIAPLHDEAGTLEAFIGIQKEIDAVEAPADVSSDQDSMMLELQHRVKNHLAMIVGMIRMQARREISRDSFEALSHRVQSLALLYEELSPVGVGRVESATVPAGAYLSRVANTLGALDGRSSIRINVECEEIELPVDTSARLGLLLTEFLTNALEHAFPDGRDGVIRIRFQRQTGDAVRLVVEDDGVGMPEGSDWPSGSPSIRQAHSKMTAEESADGDLPMRRASGMGGTIVAGLATSLGARIDVSHGLRGTMVLLDLEVPPK